MYLQRHAEAVLAPLVFVGALAWLGAGMHVGHGGGDTPPFHCDEGHKLSESYYYHLFFEQRDLHHPAWTEDFYARINPPVAKYIFGAALTAAGHPVRDQQLQSVFDMLWEHEEDLRQHVPDAMLRVTRWTSIVFGAGICALLFIIGWRAAGPAAGLIAVLLLAGDSTFALYAQRGLTDTILLFFLALIVPVTMGAAALLRRHWLGDHTGGTVRRWGPVLLATVLVPGLAIALAAGTKLNGSLTGPCYAAGLLAAALLCGGARSSVWRRLGLVAVVTGLTATVAIVLFVGLNPYFHHDPARRLPGILDIWADWMVIMQIHPGEGLFTIPQKITAVGYYSLCDSSLPLTQWLNALHLGRFGSWLTILGFAVGVVYLAGRCLPRPRTAGEASDADAVEDRRRLRQVITSCWVLICTAGVTLWLPLLCDRHLLPAYLTICLTTAIGLAVAPRAIGSVIVTVAGRSAGHGGFRVTCGALSVVVLWIALALTPWVIGSLPEQPREVWWSSGASDSSADTPWYHARFAGLLFYLNLDREAAERAETALSLMDREDGQQASPMVLRARVLHILSHTRAAMGHREAGIAALGQYIDVLTELRNAMRTDDPCVRRVYAERIAESRAAMDRLAQAPPGKPGHDLADAEQNGHAVETSRPAAAHVWDPSHF